jgi:hypothetical protein
VPPLHDVAHLAHIELRTPVLDDSDSFHTHGTPPVAGATS